MLSWTKNVLMMNFQAYWIDPDTELAHFCHFLHLGGTPRAHVRTNFKLLERGWGTKIATFAFKLARNVKYDKCITLLSIFCAY